MMEEKDHEALCRKLEKIEEVLRSMFDTLIDVETRLYELEDEKRRKRLR